ncbi:hypothetical protein LCGC14_2464370, partial [marine sediment metagenome]
DPGQVYFSTGGTGVGTISGSTGTWEFQDNFERVTLLNFSKKNLIVNDIEVVNTTVDPIVDLLNTSSLTLTYFIERTVAPTLVDIENLNDDPPDVTISGVIENPIGTTRVVVVDGDILSTGSRSSADSDPASLIRTNILDLEANEGDIGTSSSRINIDLVDSDSAPFDTEFITARVSGADGTIFLGSHHLFTGQVVRYTSSNPLGSLSPGDYYSVIASADGLSIQLAAINTPNSPIVVSPSASLTHEHALTPAQRFTVIAEGDPNAGDGNAYLDVKARLRNNTAPMRAPVADYSVVVDAVVTDGNADLKLWGSVQETDVSGTTYPGAPAGTAGGVKAKFEGNAGVRHFDFFRPDTPPGPALDPGVFANQGASATHIDSTYDLRAFTTDGDLFRPGIVAGRNIIITHAQPVAGSGKIINIYGITEIVGTGFVEGSSDVHHIDVLTNGSITIKELTHDLRVGRIASTASDVLLFSPRRIVDALDDGIGSEADVTGVNITMTAGDNEITGTGADK